MRKRKLQGIVLKFNDCYVLKNIAFSDLGEAKDFFADDTVKRIYVLAWKIEKALTSQLNYYKSLVYPPPPIPESGIDKRIKIPTLIIWGTQDRWISTDNIKDVHLSKYLDNYKVKKIPSAGHCVNHEASSIVNQAIFDFVSL